jgi:acyl-CoA reductase-like NAD-dependent aldehyde dehydrogenase
VINPAQVRVIDDHVDDALARGASLTTERRRDGMLVHPLVLRDTNHAMKVMTEETFGPVMPIMPFRSQAEAVALANDSVFGLNASVWTSDLDRGAAVASSIVCGSCAVNDVLKNIANPHMPFGGEKQSGLGRYHGPEGLLAFCRTKSVMISSGRAKKEINWFPYTQRGYSSLRALLRLLYGEAPVTRRMLRLATDLARGRGR